MGMITNVMNSCGVSKDEAKKLIQEELQIARENFVADGDLQQATDDFLSGLGLDQDYDIQAAQMIAGC